MKKIVSPKELKFLQQEMNDCSSKGLITNEQKENILNVYEAKVKMNFIKILVTIGAVLMGLGVISFIASNWVAIGRITKFSIIISSFLGANAIAYYIEENYPKTSRSLNYLSIFIFGAGIFLIGQMFHFGGDFSRAFFLWTLGALPMAVILKDKFLLILTMGFLAIYLNGYGGFWSLEKFPFMILVILPVLYYFINRYFAHDSTTIFFANLLGINVILLITNYWNMDAIYVAFMYFVIGLTMYFVAFPFARRVFRFQGSIIMGITGVILTIPSIWHDVFLLHSDLMAIMFAVVFIGFLLFLTKKQDLVALIFICIVIFRYYVDTLYNFMPKSLFFMISGLILLGFGYYFEKVRRRKIDEGEIVYEE